MATTNLRIEGTEGDEGIEQLVLPVICWIIKEIYDGGATTKSGIFDELFPYETSAPSNAQARGVIGLIQEAIARAAA